MGLGMEIGIDLGTSSVLIYVRGKGVVLKEPSVVAVNTKTGKCEPYARSYTGCR